VQVGLDFLAFQQISEAFGTLIGEDADFVRKIALQTSDLRFFNAARTLVFILPLAGEDLAIDNGAFNARRAIERRVLDVSGFFAEDRAEQFLFRRQLRFAFRRDFADQNVARLYRRTDADYARFIQIAQERIRDVGNVARDFFRSQFGVACLDFEFFNVDRGVVVFANQLFADQNRVFEVVTAPRHERDQHVPPSASSPISVQGHRPEPDP